MLTTVPQILEYVHQEYQIGANTSDDDFLRSCISRNYYNRSQRLPYKQRIVQTASFTTATSTQTYAVSSDFGRLVPDSVRYGVTTGSQNPPQGYYLPEVNYEQSQLYKGACTGPDPHWCTIVGSTAAVGKAMHLFPGFTNSGSVVQYSYYTQATSLGTTATLPIQELGFVIAYDTLRDYAIHKKNPERKQEYSEMSKEAWRSVFANAQPDT